MFTKKIFASLVLAGFLSNSFASPALIYNYGNTGGGGFGATDELTSRHLAVGNTVTTIDLTSTYDSYTPSGLSSYLQVWDLGAFRALTTAQANAYTSYLQGGGSLFIAGEYTNANSTAANAALLSFISSLGGGSVGPNTGSMFSLSTVAPQFRIANSASEVILPGGGPFSSPGTGTCITADCVAVAWGLGTLANAPLGTLVVVADISFLQTYNMTQEPTYRTQDFTDNLIAYLARQGQIVTNAYALRSVYNIQSAALNAGLSHDCNVFDKQGICLSTGGRYSTTNSPETTTTSGLLVGSYKYDKNIRLGAWVDQNLSTNNTDGIKLGNSKPLLGVFGVWSERNDGLGYEVKVSAGYGDKDIEVTRTATNQGSAKITSKGIQSISSYGIALDSNWIAAPYVGVKYLSVKRGGYTEGGFGALTYDILRQETTSAVAGVRFTGKIDSQTHTVLSAGVEQDLNHNVGMYSATSGNRTVFNSKVQKTRPVISAGVFYDIDKTQRVGLNAIHRQEAFQSTTSTTALATYTVGF